MPREDLTANDLVVAGTGYKIRYQPKGAALTLFERRDDEVLLAGPAGTGKSLGCLHKLHLCMSKYPGARAFMARKTRVSMTNSCLKSFDKDVLKPPDKVHFHKQDQIYYYPNGSEIFVVGLDDPQRIMSTNFDMGYIMEATECTQNDIEMCTTRLRNFTMPYQQLIMDCNPDKPTHHLKLRADSGLTLLLESHHEDNPRLWDEYHQRWTTEGLAYMAKLDRLSGARFSRLRKGIWAAAEGLVYTEWDMQKHLITLADLPKGWDEWPHYWVIDWGFTHPLCWQCWIEDPQGRIYLLRQIYQTRTLVEDLAGMVLELMKGQLMPRAIICDHDAGDRANFERHTGLMTLPAYKSINIGVQAVKARLDPDWRGLGTPGLFILRDSLVAQDPDLKAAGKPISTEEEMDGYVWDDKRNAKSNSAKDEIPLDKDNHGMDALRYMVAFIDDLAVDLQESEEVLADEEDYIISPY